MKLLTQIFQALLGVAALISTTFIAAGRLAWRTICNWWHNRPKWLLRSIAAIFALLVLGFAITAACTYYKCKYGKSYWGKEFLSEEVFVQPFNDGKYRIYNRTTKRYTTPKVGWVAEAPCGDDTLTVYSLNGKRGFVDVKSGAIVIDAEANNYTKAWVFSEGVAAVERDGKIGFINAMNEVVIPFQFDYSNKHDMNNLACLFHNGYCTMTNAEGKLGLINKSGEWVVEPQYGQIWAPQEMGYRVVIKGEKHGMLDQSLNLIYDTVYDYVGNHSETGGFILMKGGRMWQEDFDGRVLQAFMYESLDELSYPIGLDNEGYNFVYKLSDYSKYRVACKYGILNRVTGEVVTLAIYDDIRMLSSNLFEVDLSDNYGQQLVDINGNIVKR